MPIVPAATAAKAAARSNHAAESNGDEGGVADDAWASRLSPGGAPAPIASAVLMPGS